MSTIPGKNNVNALTPEAPACPDALTRLDKWLRGGTRHRWKRYVGTIDRPYRGVFHIRLDGHVDRVSGAGKTLSAAVNDALDRANELGLT
jgi:hypothetical protein